MAKKHFKTESKKLLDMMVNSIYTHKEIFLRELISNASDAIDKLYFRSLTDDSVTLTHGDYEIRITPDKDARTITITDNGCGMNESELENNLGTIAKSGSFDFKNEQSGKSDVDIIGQFGVGFYSAFMVSDRIKVISRAYGSDEAFAWESSGADGYTVTPCEKESAGTEIILHIKEDTEQDNYSSFLEEYKIRELVKKYSDYIRYPIRMLTTHEHLKEGSEDEYETVEEDATLNSMTPIWKRSQDEVSDEEYASFYKEKFYDFTDPLKVIRQKAEGTSEYTALLFIPSTVPYNYYSREFEKGLQLYSSGVMISEKCKELLPDYYSFVRGLVDSSDLSLNISREMLQHDHQLKIIAKALEKKINSELKKMLSNDREKYEKFFDAFGTQLKYGIYADYGMHKQELQDLLLFRSSQEEKYTTLKEYTERMPSDQKEIYFASAETVSMAASLPRARAVAARGFEVLYLTEDVDEFAFQMMRDYDEKEFCNVCKEDLDLDTDESKELLKEENEKNAGLLGFISESIGDAVTEVRFTNSLGDQPVGITTKGMLSIGMEKVLSKMPGGNAGMKSEVVLEISDTHPVADKVKALYGTDNDKLASFSKLLYSAACLVSGIAIDNPAEVSSLICSLMTD